MGLRVEIYRSDYDSTLNVFHGKKAVTVIDIPGPFEPTEDAPAAALDRNPFGSPIIVPDGIGSQGSFGVRGFGGTFAGSSDSRFHEAVGIYGAIPIHDRIESWGQYERFSR